jgi:alkanesulfonate monooxygenase SsuD/methylene tetrahydromethanopterin reductase-like flavin-dependent oxidoreductase (luciferase family)
VLPLHEPLTVVEDWAFVDHLSCGRVGRRVNGEGPRSAVDT